MLPIIFILLVKGLVEYSPISICLFKLFTGHECWGCGITRAFNELFNLNIQKAFEYNPRILIIAPLMLYIWIDTLKTKIKKVEVKIKE